MNFVQPSPVAVAVNRIFDINGTEILGHLNANGQVYLINPNGILFGQGAQVNVGGLVASTLDLNGVRQNGNTRSFSGDGAGSIVNQGAITAAEDGYVVLLGNHVGNQGTISAQLGTVALGAGSAATLTFSDNALVHMQVDQSVFNSLVENDGLVRADGGKVVMTAGAKQSLLASVVNNTGVIQARTVENHDGVITLLGGMTAGAVNVGGTLDASAPSGGNGGFVETSAAHVKIASDANVTTSAPVGHYGTWLIDPQDFTVAATGGDMTGAALSSNLATTPVTLQSSGGAAAGSGNVNITDAVTWSANTTLTLTASNNVNVNADITATGNTAGLVINPNAANGTETASGMGAFNLSNARVAITLSGTNPSLSIGGLAYTVINSLGVAADAASPPASPSLQGMTSSNLAGHYALGTDIDASATFAWNAGAGFVPIGTVGVPFNGTFDGLGHTISSVTVNLPAVADVGLFGSTGTSSVIRNVGMSGGSVAALSSGGGLVGSNTGTIISSHNTGSVGGGSSLGGLMGSNTGTVSYSYATGTVNGTSSLGGLMGSNTGTVSNSYATGNVTGTSSLGGLMGSSTTGTVSNSYATGDVSGTTSVGGLMGSSTGPVIDTYATGAVSGTTSVGGLMGSSSGPVTSSYWNTDTSGQPTSPGGSGLTSAQMLHASNFSGWDFASTWTVYDGLTDPLLLSFMAPLTVTANNATKVYDANAFTGGNGVTYSSTPNSNLLGTPTYAGTSQGAINAGNYVITPSGLYSSQQGYVLSYIDGSLTVTAAPLTVTVDAKSRLYGAANPPLTYVSAGLLKSDTLSGSLATTATTTSNVGPYAITQGTLANSNYSITYTGANLTVTTAPLTVTADPQSRLYGTANPTLTYVSSGLVSGDTLSGLLATTAITTSNIGPYAITQGTLANSNYSIAYTGASLTVTTAPLTVTANTQSRIYGASNPTLTYTSAGLVNGDTLSGLLATTATTTSNIGPYAITQGTLANSNYSIAYTGTNLTVTTAPLAVTADAQSRLYGRANPTLTYTSTGLVNGDTLSGLLATTATTASSIGPYPITQGTLSASSNYSISYLGASLAVTAAPLAVTGVGASNKVYDATNAASLTGVASVTPIGSDQVAVMGIGNGVFANKNVGIGKIVTVSGFSLTGADAGNYAIVQPTNLLADVTAAPLAITGVTASDKPYDATTVATLDGTANVVPLGNDQVAVGGAPVGMFVDPAVGAGKPVIVSGFTLSGADAANYALVQPATITADITAGTIAMTLPALGGVLNEEALLESNSSGFEASARPDFILSPTITVSDGTTGAPVAAENRFTCEFRHSLHSAEGSGIDNRKCANRCCARR